MQSNRLGIEVLRNVGLKEVNEVIKSSELFEQTLDKNGKIESIDFNTTIVNDALITAAKNVRKRLKEIETGKNLPDEFYQEATHTIKDKIIYEVPLGVVFGNNFLSNLGPRIPVRIKYAGNVGLDVKTKVSQYGLNSALIEIYVYIEVTQRTILPFSSKDVKLTSEIPVVMKVVKGDIPNYLSGYNKSYQLPLE